MNMRCSIKLPALLLAIWMTISGCLTVYASEESAKGTDTDEAVQVLTALKIIAGGADGTFKPEDPVTRGELTDVIIRMLGLAENQEINTEKTTFADVYGDPHIASIYTAYDLGIISGDPNSNFRPDENATYEQAVKMILSALGYDDYAKYKGGYPAGYLYMAAQLDITDGVSGEVGKDVTKGMLAKLVFNALDVDLVQKTGFNEEGSSTITKGKTVLSEKLKVKRQKGMVTAQGQTNIYGAKTHKEDEVEIDRVPYKIGECDVKGLLGYQVVFYYSEERGLDEKTLAAIWKDKNQQPIIEVPADQIVRDTTKNLFQYYPDKEKKENIKKATIDQNADVIFNQVAYRKASAIEDEDLKPVSGKVVLFDTNDNGKYDLVFVTSYENLVVDRINTSTKEIGFKNRTDSLEVEESVERKVVVLEEGDESQFTKIKQWDVLAVEESKDGSLITIHIVRDKVEGTVSEMSDEDIGVDGTMYKMSSGLQDTITVGTAGVFYLDIEGKIAAVDRKNSTGFVYGYLRKTGLKKGLSGVAQFDIFGADGKWKHIESADKVLYNNADTYEGSDLISLPTIKDRPQLIKYKVNEDGQLSEILTYIDMTDSSSVGYEENYPGYDKQKRFTKDYKESKAIYWDPMIASRYIVASDTVVFVVPNDLTKDKEFIASKGKDRLVHNSTNHDIEIYDATEDKVAKAIVRYMGNGAGSYSQINSGSGGAITVVDKVTRVINENGDYIYKLYGLRNGSAVTLQADENGVLDRSNLQDNATSAIMKSTFRHAGTSIEQLHKGDIIVYATNASGKLDNMFVVYQPSVASSVYFVEDCALTSELTIGSYHSEFYYGIGKAVKIGTQTLVYNAHGDGKDRKWDRSVYLNGAKIYLYNSKTDKVSIAKASDVAEGDKLFVRLHWTRIQVDVVIIR